MFGLTLVCLAALGDPAPSGETPATPARVLTRKIDSRRQAGPTQVRILQPDRIDPNRRYRVVYVLPVEAGDGNRYGDGLEEIRRKGLHNEHDVICVAPTFHHLPWYADHPTDPRIAQEKYFLEDVLPLVEKELPVKKERAGRLLLGFSKSGFGAFTLLLRNPQTFERAVAWDAPLAMTDRNRFGAAPIYGSDENFARYQIFPLLDRNAESLSEAPARLALAGWSNFHDDHLATHAALERLKIPHAYRDEKSSPHDWHSGWVEWSMGWLCGPAR